MQVNEQAYFGGPLVCADLQPNAGCISNTHVASAAAIATTKLRHKHRKILHQPNVTATTETRPIHVVVGAVATVVAIKAGTIAACLGSATITVDLKNNGTSILTGVITLDSSNTNRIVEAGTIASPDLVRDDFLELVITVAAEGGTLATGLLVELEVDEDAQ